MLIGLLTMNTFASDSNEHLMNREKSTYYYNKIDKISSPGLERFVVHFENGYSKEMAATQVFVGFGNEGGDAVFVANDINHKIELEWVDDNNLNVIIPHNLTILKSGNIIIHNDQVINIHYIVRF